MSLIEITLEGHRDKVQMAIDLLRDFEPPEGYYLAFSGGYGNGERLGTLVVSKQVDEFTDEDLLLAEYAATVLGVRILHEREAEIQEETRKKVMVQIAFSTLSYSELEAIVNILGELDGKEGLLIASKIADRVGITRSVIVNALRKFESADLIETRSLGMKGTFIRVKNEYLFDELKKIK